MFYICGLNSLSSTAIFYQLLSSACTASRSPLFLTLLPPSKAARSGQEFGNRHRETLTSATKGISHTMSRSIPHSSYSIKEGCKVCTQQVCVGQAILPLVGGAKCSPLHHLVVFYPNPKVGCFFFFFTFTVSLYFPLGARSEPAAGGCLIVNWGQLTTKVKTGWDKKVTSKRDSIRKDPSLVCFSWDEKEF